MLLKSFKEKYGLEFYELHSDECPENAKTEYFYLIGALTGKMMEYFGLTLDQVQDMHKRLLQEIEVTASRELMRFVNGKKPKLLTEEQYKHYQFRIENEVRKLREGVNNRGSQ